MISDADAKTRAEKNNYKRQYNDALEKTLKKEEKLYYCTDCGGLHKKKWKRCKTAELMGKKGGNRRNSNKALDCLKFGGERTREKKYIYALESC